MNQRVEVLLATMNQVDTDIVKKMNVKTPIVIANQAHYNDYYECYKENNRMCMMTTTTKGVGLNRNIALLLAREDILLFSDDDIVYCDGYEKKILDAFSQLPQADVIVFSVQKRKEGKILNPHLNTTKRLKIYNVFKYGTYAIAVKKDVVLKHNLSFSLLFGGGCIYGSGEDSLFLAECLKCGLKVYSHESLIAINTMNESTWFSGFNEKYFYDKGAWLACAFPILKDIIKWYFVIRFFGRTRVSWKMCLTCLNEGIKGFGTLRSFDEWDATRMNQMIS